jgi:type VI secretion system protein ImpM
MPVGPLRSGEGTMAREAPGWYGKLASLGDFAQRRLPSEFVEIADGWLSRSLAASRQQLGAGWLDIYLTAPVIRFAWAPGVADASWWFGVMMPSCDNVGRYFPLLIAHPRARPPLDRIALNHLEAWYDHLATAATHTLADSASLETFEDALDAALPWPTPAPGGDADGESAVAEAPIAAGGVERYRLGKSTSPGSWLQAMATADLCTRLSGRSIWWRPQFDHDATGTGASVLLSHGLPEASAFAGLLAGS